MKQKFSTLNSRPDEVLENLKANAKKEMDRLLELYNACAKILMERKTKLNSNG